ncbi:amino acid adenylation domain-containing protein [Streptomyces sp. NPDC056337]|uniref:amino acid adenylation domain-containing protein n=1 Tax=Streptomyces sp. NPDC056337 TaxID=3345787 RepID=UPI0035DD8627
MRLSLAQQDLWVYETLYPQTGALNLCVAYHFDEPTDARQLTEALTLLQRNHDILRTRISGDPSAPDQLQVDYPARGPFQLEHLDLGSSDRPLDDVLNAFRSRTFDLTHGGQLIRGQLITVDDYRSTLVLCLHHLITDWWSFDVLHTEFADAYQAVKDGGTPPQRPHLQYADFASWQHELDAAGVIDAGLDFWESYLGTPPPPLTVPGATRSSDDFGIAQVTFQIDQATERAVRALARVHGSTVYGVLISAFAAFAARLSGNEDLILGTPIANRAAKGLERVIGYVMNSVPTRWHVGPDETFSTLLRRFASEFGQVLTHADVPVGKIVQRTDPERHTGRSPLFQWVFMYLPQQQSVRRLQEFSAPQRIHTGGEYDLVGVVHDDERGFHGTFDFRTDIYDPVVVQHWADGFAAMLTQLTTHPGTPVQSHIPLTATDRQHLTHCTDAGPAPVSLPGLVHQQASETPDAPALEADDTALTYRALANRVARLANTLRQRGVIPGSVVALALRRGVTATIAALAVQQAGAAYLPVDPEYPAERLRYILDDAQPVLLVTEPGSGPLDLSAGLPVLHVTEAAFDTDPLPVSTPHPDDAAYIIYTSGSTGRPKGVIVPHRGIAGLAQGMAEGFALGPHSRLLQLGSPSFDISVGETAMAFHAGATLVIAPNRPLVGDALSDFMREQRVTAALMPPVLLGSMRTDATPDLRTICSGAEAFPAALATRWAAPGRRVLNAYGPTEATVGPTLSDPLPGDGTTPPIGRPHPGVRAYVLDNALRPCPIGVRGELYLAGRGLAWGYLGRSALTAERFIPDPYGPPGSRMYRSGDLARVLPDGQLDYLGRADEQMKLNGLRLEPGEIETVLSEHPSVKAVVVALREDPPSQPRLVAYCIPSPAHQVEARVLRSHAASRLPAGMVPLLYVELDQIPTTPAGKTDRTALPAPNKTVVKSTPPSPHVATLCDLIATLLGRSKIPADADFFDLGGDSIMAIQLVGRARVAGLEFTPADVFRLRTPQGIATAARLIASLAGSPAEDGEGPVPLTPIMHMWRERGGPVENFTMRAIVPTPAGIDSERIEGALRTLTDRHSALRMRVSIDEFGHLHALEVGPPSAGALLTRVEAPGLDARKARAAAEDVHDAVRLAPEIGLLLRAVWFDPGNGGPGWLLLNVHHLAVDGVSLHIINTELGEMLAGRVLPATPHTSFRRWAELQQTDAERAATELPHWEATLAHPEASLLDTELRGHRACLTIELPPPTTRTILDHLPTAFRCGVDVVLLTALTAAAARWRNIGSALLVDLEGHGRAALPNTDVSGTVGWFTIQHPVLLDTGAPAGVWAHSAQAAEALKQVKEQMAQVPDHGRGWGLLRYLNPATISRLAALPSPDIQFNYLGRITEGDLDLLDVEGLPLAHLIELDVIAHERADGPHLVATWSYPDGALDTASITQLAHWWTQALATLTTTVRDGKAGGFTRSDFPLVDLTQDELDMLQEGL